MKIYNDRISLWNEGELPEGLTVDWLLAEHTSKPRNPLIASVFYKAGFIETWGRGISKIIKGFKAQKLPVPTFEPNGGGLRVNIQRTVAQRLYGSTTEKTRTATSGNVVRNVVRNVVKKTRETF